MFDYKGYSKEELIDLCSEKDLYKGVTEWKYWTPEVYSFGKHLRDYGFYPKWLPLYIYSDHGVDNLNIRKIPAHEINNNAYCMLCHSTEKRQAYTKVSQKHCYNIYSPFVFYRKNNKIKKSPNAKGTLVFPAHTTSVIDDMSNIEEYINQIKALPEEFHPICVCLHMHDIHKGQYELYIKNGISVYTAGHAQDFRFAQRFYNILKNFKYSTSNMIGSYTYYSVEMNIPFFIYGNKPIFLNHADPNLEKGEYKFQEEETYIKLYKMFEGLNTEITTEQKEHVEKGLGIYDGVSRLKMAQILYTAYFIKGGSKDTILQWLKYIKRYPLFFFRKEFWQALFS